MKDPSGPLSEAVFVKLQATAAVRALLGDPVRAYDKTPAAPTYPYARIGDDQVLGRSNACADAWEAFVTVHVFSRHPAIARLEVKDAVNAIVGALVDDASLPTPTGFKIGLSELEQSRTYIEDDGVTAHGVLVIRYLIADAA